MTSEDKELDADDIERRMNAGIRRALSTPPTPTKELVGKTERAKVNVKVERLKRVDPSQKATEPLKPTFFPLSLYEVVYRSGACRERP